ncbi:MAG: GNAT family N-acetyltransferase [Cyanobacteria bacterium NC_groundwater_1444_Ag_S-0.65um_54_12]|nr:GNAT family N-acetyltransferase [Cyanobacteria bacterium NC_groundwater_1444_Ag_S-0.65um_54_12]
MENRLMPVISKQAIAQVSWGQLALLEPEDGPILQALCENCTDYFELITGLPTAPSEAQSLFVALPEGKDYDDKVIVGLFDHQQRMIGVLDAIRGYPSPTTWYLGLLLFEPSQRQRGMGREAYLAFERWAAEAGAHRMRLGAVTQNPRGIRFWQQLGFTEVLKRRIKQGVLESECLVMEREIISP